MLQKFQSFKVANMFYIRFTLVAICLLFTSAKATDITVDVEQGTLLGNTEDFVENEYINVSMKIDIFKGVPYAEPPKRFMPPEPKQSWEGTFNATSFSDWCPQYLNPSFFNISSPQSEDCLYLNIYAPNGLTEKVPVMVFIHGGGFTIGSSMYLDYSGTPLAAVGNIVVVTINYRVGALGFLDTGDAASPGNFGLLDQVEALKWINQNIEAFGGDSSRITIFGESAGGASVDLLVISKKSRDLFQQAITESGTALCPWAYTELAEAIKVDMAFNLGNAVGCNTMDTQELVECLKQVDAEELEKIVATNFIRMGPTIDGVFLDDSPLRLTDRGDFKHCPMILGFNKDEGTAFFLIDNPDLLYADKAPFVDKAYFDRSVTTSLLVTNGVSPKIVEDAVKQQYVPWEYADNEDFDYFEYFNPIYGDEAFSCPTVKTARAHAMMTSEPLFLYLMTIAPTVSTYGDHGKGPKWLGAAHAEELQYVFGYPFIPEMLTVHGIMSDEEKEVSVKFMKFWTNFAKSGDPSRSNSSSSPGEGEWAWPTFTIPELHYKELSFEMKVDRGLKADECNFWNEFEPELQSFVASMDQSELEWREEFSGWQDDLEEWRMSFSDYQNEPTCET
ncbi:cholinesterase-like isoform X2 [Apostichopus japonicus]|uniref:cholinesterase-like isoform X2 n=1 Tax=Stichopus japonicus TaxID=307972 RepID=UPI003AB475DC